MPEHLHLLTRDIKTYFSQKYVNELESKMRIGNHFINSYIDLSDIGGNMRDVEEASF